MTNQEKINLIEEMLDIEQGTIHEETKVSDVENWDSMAIISFIALVDDLFGKTIKGEQIKKIETINNLLEIMEK